ncbi:MAG: small basic family protein, partial [Chloroflexi bacterium]|nr:small basic family protein [Chloroflexota bacterium]
MFLPLVGLLVGVLAGLVLNVNVSYELSRYSAVAILAALDSVLGAVRAELDGVYDNRVFISGFITNAVVAVLLTFIGDRLGL